KTEAALVAGAPSPLTQNMAPLPATMLIPWAKTAGENRDRESTNKRAVSGVLRDLRANIYETAEAAAFCAGLRCGRVSLTEIFHHPDFVPDDVVFAIQCVTPIGRDRKTSAEFCRCFREDGESGHFARCQIDELQYRRRLLCVHKVNAALAQPPETMACYRQRFADQFFILAGQTSIRQPGRERNPPDSRKQHTAVV